MLPRDIRVAAGDERLVVDIAEALAARPSASTMSTTSGFAASCSSAFRSSGEYSVSVTSTFARRARA
jgi:hypothetical protein